MGENLKVGKIRKIVMTIASIIAQLLCLFYVIYWIFNPENETLVMQISCLIIWGLMLLMWLLVDVSDILEVVIKRNSKKLEDDKN